MKRIYVHRRFERFWHWCQALLIVLLGATGFEIHDSIRFFGFQQGTGIEDHKVNGHVAIHVLDGRVEVSGGGRTPTPVASGEFIGLDGMRTFTLRALEESYAIITFEQAEGVAEPARGNDQGTQVTK